METKQISISKVSGSTLWDVREGKIIEITSHRRPVALLIPCPKSEKDLQDLIQELSSYVTGSES